MFEQISKIKNIFDKAVNGVTILLMVILTYVTFHQVVARYVFSNPPAWAEEVSRFLFVWSTFLGAAIAVRYGAHLGVDFFVERFPKKMQTLISIIIYLMMIVIFIYTIIASFEIIQKQQNQLSPILRISMVYPYLAIPVGTGIMLLETVWLLITRAVKGEVK